MAGARFILDTSTLKPLEARVRVMASMDTSALMPRLGEYLLRSTQNRFKSQTAPDGTAWEALAPRTAKRKKYNPDKVLIERGFLRKGMAWQLLNKTTVEVGSNLAYAAAHQFGMKQGYAGRGKYKTRRGSFPIPWGDIPARPFLGLSDQDERKIDAIIRSWAAELGFK